MNATYQSREGQPEAGKGYKPFRIFLLMFILLLCWVSSLFIETKASSAQEIQKGIANEIIRFHVIANSDSSEDQALKLKVKDTLVQELSPELKTAKDISEAREIIRNNLTKIQDTAAEVIKSEGCDYPVTASLESCYFPLKVYDNYTFPPGTYEALRVQIGEAQGHNWWCVMFPPLCFVDETYGIVDDDTDAKLKYLLTEEEYNTLKDQKAPVKVRFKLLESVKKLFAH